MNYKILAVFCVFFSLVFLGSATRRFHSDIYNAHLNDDQIGGDDYDDDGSSQSRMLIADHAPARDTDIEGTVAYVDGNCVLVRTCFPSNEFGGKLACTEEHVCEF